MAARHWHFCWGTDGVVLVSSLEDLLATKLQVLLQRVETKDYIDIAALLTRGLSLNHGLGSAIALFGKTFSPIDCLRALGYFDDPALGNLPQAIKTQLQAAIKTVIKTGEPPKVPLLSSHLD